MEIIDCVINYRLRNGIENVELAFPSLTFILLKLFQLLRLFAFRNLLLEACQDKEFRFFLSCFDFPFRCYLVDNLANLVTDPDFLLVSTTDAREYERVSLGRKEGDIMKLLVTKHKFFVPNQRVDFQGICSVSQYAPKVSICLNIVSY